MRTIIILLEYAYILVLIVYVAGRLYDHHMVEIFKSLPMTHLAIFPGEMHYTPVTNTALFNATVDWFLQTEFCIPDPMQVIKSLSK